MTEVCLLSRRSIKSYTREIKLRKMSQDEDINDFRASKSFSFSSNYDERTLKFPNPR